MSASTTATGTIPGAKGHTDGAGAFVPVQTRTERPRSLDPADFSVPTGREVNWRYAPVERLAAVFAGAPAGQIETVVAGPVEAKELAIGEQPRGEFFRAEDLAAALAWDRSERALHVEIPRDAELDDPIVVTVSGSDSAAVGYGHVVIEAQPHSKATVLIEHTGSAQYAQNVEILVRDGAHLSVISVQRWDDDAVHVSSHQARVDRDAFLRHIVVSLGGGVVRVNPSTELDGSGSEGELYGLSFSDSGQFLESQVFLHHKGPQTRGDVLYKSALQGERARTAWIGDVLIGRNAVGTDSYEANRNLVLTTGARADSVPNLEIETGDIQGAGHASATGRFDEEQLFYLQARGISEDEARRLVVIGFLAEIIQKVGLADLREELLRAVEDELARGQAV